MDHPELDSTRGSVPHCEEITIPAFSSLPRLSEDDNETSTSDEVAVEKRQWFWSRSGNLLTFQQHHQQELNDLVRDLNLSNAATELLASGLKINNLLSLGTNILFDLKRDRNLLPFRLSRKYSDCL